MKKIKTTDITTGVAMPVKKGTLDHLQAAYQEPLADIIQMFEAKNDTEGFPNFTTPVILYGCRRTGLGVSQGVIIYGNEIYRCPAATITLGFGQVVIGTITTTNVTSTDADPVEFSNAATYNVHEIRQIVWSAGTSGSGDFDLTSCVMFGRWTDIVYNASYLVAATGNWTLPGGASDWSVKFKQEGRTIDVDYSIKSSSISSATASITLSLPFNANFKADYHGICHYINSNQTPTSGIGRVVALAGTKNIIIYPAQGGNWAADIGTIFIAGQIRIELDKF